MSILPRCPKCNSEGTVIAEGPPQEILTHSEVRKVYLGEQF